MTQDEFKLQIPRLVTRFGDKSFDVEFVKLIWAEVHDMTEYAFKQTVDVFIGSRTHHKPPLLSDFREARLNYFKGHLAKDASSAAAKILHYPGMSKSVGEILSKEFGAVESVSDALQIARLRLLKKGDT